MLLSKIAPYLKLMRLHQPVGIFLLMWPCWIAVAFSTHGRPDINILLLFALGSVVMRSAGCIVNDLADVKFDRQVERTRTRPLASGEISKKRAMILLLVLLITAFIILLQFNPLTVIVGMVSLFPVFIYPFMKRFTYWPQAFLGLTFNWGVLLGFTSSSNLNAQAIVLYIGFICWTLAYDTIYALQDIKDDLKIGVKSTAILFGQKVKAAVSLFFTLFWLSLYYTGSIFEFGTIFKISMVLAGLHMFWQVKTLKPEVPLNARQRFFSNNWLGALIFLGLCLDAALLR